MNKWISPKVKQLWHVAMHGLLHAFFWGGGHNHNSLPLGPIQPSSHSTEELLDLAYDLLQRTKF